MKLSMEYLRRASIPLIGFIGDVIDVEEEIDLSLTVGIEPRQSTIVLSFMVIRVPSTYNTILGRPGLNALKVIVSTYHLLVQFATKVRVREMRGDQQIVKHCLTITVKKNKLNDSSLLERLD